MLVAKPKLSPARLQPQPEPTPEPVLTKYIMLHYDGKRPANEREVAQTIAAWTAWFNEVGAALIDGGSPFGHVKTVTAEDSTDGIRGERSSGYSIIEAPDMEEAVALADRCPTVAQGGRVEVYEAFKVI